MWKLTPQQNKEREGGQPMDESLIAQACHSVAKVVSMVSLFIIHLNYANTIFLNILRPSICGILTDSIFNIQDSTINQI
jgi:hypothetical protein